MEEKHKLIIWIVVDLLLLIGVIANALYWFDIAQTLKAPCVKCAGENESLKEPLKDCLNKPYNSYVINLSDLEIENKQIKNNG